jgi:trans-aconitate 2-methyltransferase
MLDRSAVAEHMFRALRPGGRLVAELGGKRNIARIEEAVRGAVTRVASGEMPISRTYFPSLGEYASLLEQVGFEMRFAALFERPTPLEGEQGMENWILQFMSYYLDVVPAPKRRDVVREIVSELKPALYQSGIWNADYVRLRIVAMRP